jgi:hypothetical protein
MRNLFVFNRIFCCTGFQHRITDAGQRGIAILVIKTSDGIQFRIQSRGIAYADEDKINPIPNAPDYKINISCETGLLYCPFCGKKLHNLVRKHPKAFEEIAEMHRKFYS